MTQPKIRPEVSESTHLRRLTTELVKESEKDNVKLSSDERSAMVDNVIDTLAQPVAILFQNIIDNEFAFYGMTQGDGSDEDDGEDESGEGDAEGDESGEGEVIEGDFTETSDGS